MYTHKDSNDEPDDWTLIDNIKDVAAGLGLLSTDNAVPTDPIARQAFRKKVLEPQQQQRLALANEELLREQEKEIRVLLEHHQTEKEVQVQERTVSKSTEREGERNNNKPAKRLVDSSRGQQRAIERKNAMHDIVSQHTLHLQQALEEDLAILNVGVERRNVQAKNTKDLYAKYQEHWNVSSCS